MALKIIKSNEQIKVNRIITVIYSNPGIGKTTLAFSSEKPILFDFDKGAHRAANRKDIVPVDDWREIKDVSANDLSEYSTVILDTAGRALDVLSLDIIRRDSKMGYGGALSLQGYGRLKAEFSAWLKMIKSMGKDVVLISHSSEDKKGDDLIERLDIQGGSKGEIYKASDAMARLYIENKKRVLNFSPTDVAFGKNPGCFEPLLVPQIESEPLFLAGVIQKIKDKLNELSEEQKKRSDAIEEWTSTLADAKTAADFNGLVTLAKDAEDSISQIVKGMVHSAATKAGMTFTKDKGYVDSQEVVK